MAHDFDRIIDRRHTNCQKWDGMEKALGVSPDGGLAMWVADMDIPSPPAVNDTLRNLADHGIHGYFGDDRAYRASIVHWMATRHGWEIRPDWILSTDGLVAACGHILQAFTEPGDGVVLFTPVYHAFHRIIDANDRVRVQSPMKQVDGRYEMDLDALGEQIDARTRVVFFCSPHNPGGRVWSTGEIRALAEFCAERDLLLVSDEVHMDLVYPGHAHVPTAVAAPEAAPRLITLSAASKTFNIAGAGCGQVIVGDPTLRRRLEKQLRAAGVSPNRLGAMMTTAAYAHGAEWLDELIPYLDDNRRRFDERMNALPGVESMALGATYLAWVDFTGTGLEQDEIRRRVAEVARIAANPGPSFGPGGEAHMRFNIAAPRALIADALERLETAFDDLH